MSRKAILIEAIKRAPWRQPSAADGEPLKSGALRTAILCLTPTSSHFLLKNKVGVPDIWRVWDQGYTGFCGSFD